MHRISYYQEVQVMKEKEGKGGEIFNSKISSSQQVQLIDSQFQEQERERSRDQSYKQYSVLHSMGKRQRKTQDYSSPRKRANYYQNEWSHDTNEQQAGIDAQIQKMSKNYPLWEAKEEERNVKKRQENKQELHMQDKRQTSSKEDLLMKTRTGAYIHKSFNRNRFHSTDVNIIENYESSENNNTEQVLSDISAKILKDNPQLESILKAADKNPTPLAKTSSQYIELDNEIGYDQESNNQTNKSKLSQDFFELEDDICWLDQPNKTTYQQNVNPQLKIDQLCKQTDEQLYFQTKSDQTIQFTTNDIEGVSIQNRFDTTLEKVQSTEQQDRFGIHNIQQTTKSESSQDTIQFISQNVFVKEESTDPIEVVENNSPPQHISFVKDPFVNQINSVIPFIPSPSQPKYQTNEILIISDDDDDDEQNAIDSSKIQFIPYLQAKREQLQNLLKTPINVLFDEFSLINNKFNSRDFSYYIDKNKQYP